MNNIIKTFTKTYDYITRDIITVCEISKPYNRNETSENERPQWT